MIVEGSDDDDYRHHENDRETLNPAESRVVRCEGTSDHSENCGSKKCEEHLVVDGVLQTFKDWRKLWKRLLILSEAIKVII